MKTYEIEADAQPQNLKYQILAALIFAATLFGLRYGWIVLSPSDSEKARGLVRMAVEIGIWSVSLALGMVFIRPRGRGKYTIVVEEDSITGVAEYGSWMKFVRRRTVRKGRVRSIFQIAAAPGRPDGIGVSERTVLGARIWGFVYLPGTLPEFNELKKIAESWRSSDSPSS